MVVEFEKPRYVEYKAEICAHSRNRKTGCTRCLDVCPASAIAPDGDHVAIDPFICGGCGACHSVCPTGAASYALPPATALRSAEHTSELQSLMRISYAVFCLQKKKQRALQY